jgi:ubiquitin C-terminal hydrolase
MRASLPATPALAQSGTAAPLQTGGGLQDSARMREQSATVSLINDSPRVLQLAALNAAIQRQTPSGIENRANDCFLNALIQLIGAGYQDRFNPATNPWPAHREAQAQLWAVIRQVEAGRSNVSGKAIGALRRTLCGIRLGNGTVIATEGEQEDAAEVLRHLLELALGRDDMVAVEEERRYESSEADASYSGDRSQLQTYTDKKATSVTPTGMIGVDMSHYANFHDFLYHEYGDGNVRTEFDANNRYAIQVGSEVHRVGEVSVQRRFRTLPDVLTFNLHRFRVGIDGGQHRIDRRFDMPHQLVLRTGVADAPRWEVFQLIGFVVQRGDLSGGHYVAERAVHGGWLQRDDAKASEVRSEPQERDAGYLYTYRRKAVMETKPDAELMQETKPEASLRELGDETAVTDGTTTAPTHGTIPPGTASSARLGLPNSGHDCFMNVAVQMVSGPLREVFERRRKKDRVLDAVWALAEDVAKGGSEAIELKRVTAMRALLKKAGLIASMTGEEDASELLIRLLERGNTGKDKIREKRVRTFQSEHAEAWAGKMPKDPAEYTKGRSEEQAEPSNTIVIDIVHFDTLEQFLAHRYHVGMSTTYDKANRALVRQGGQSLAVSTVKEQMQLLHLPDVLVFVLNRSIEDGGGRRRLDKTFFMPPTFTIGSPRSQSGTLRYRLTGIVMHTGSRDTGHYTAWMRHGDDWLHANDSSVTQHAHPGTDQDKGYLYTYRRIDETSTSERRVEDQAGLTADALLLDRIRQGDTTRVVQILDSGQANPRLAATDSGDTALHLAVRQDNATMVRALLRRGADPAAPNHEHMSALDLAEHLDSAEIVKLLRQPTVSDVGLLAQDVKRLDGKDTGRIARLYQRLSELDDTLNNYFGKLLGTDKAGAAVILRLKHTLHEVRTDLNTRAAAAHGIARQGPGMRPDSHRSYTDWNDNDLKTMLAGLSKDAQAAFHRFAESAKKKGGEAGKPISEGLTAAYAQPMEGFANIGPWRGDGDLEYAVGSVGWDQKAMYADEHSDFDGRLHHTQDKHSAAEGTEEALEESARKEVRKSKRNGVILDATIADPRNYELIWEKVLTNVNKGGLDPAMIREVHAPRPTALRSKTVIDTTLAKPADSSGTLDAKSLGAALELEQLARGRPSDQIRHIKPPSWLADEIKKIQTGEKSGYSYHKNDRHWLPPGVLYYEASASKGSKVKIVFDLDQKAFYVTCTHYKGYSIRDASGLHFCHPFFQVDLPSATDATSTGTTEHISGAKPGDKTGRKPKKEKGPKKR